ncbi:MAG TPA: hypothetical protein VFE62_07520 [Gemmataceae bacterium]|nr:hypothetical protein [Gemmataceae bacterium]
MAGASDARAGGAWVEFYTKGDKAVRAAIKSIADGLKTLATGVAIGAAGLAAMSAAVTGPLLHGVGVAAEWASQVTSASRTTGMSLREVQEVAAGLRVGFDELGAATGHMSTFLDGAVQGSAEATRALDRLGLSVRDLQGLNQNDRLMRIADALAAIGNEGTRISLQRAIFGRGGMALNLSGGAAGIQARQQRARDLGGIMSDADVTTMRSYNLALGELGTLTRGIWSTVGAAVAPALTNIINGVVSAGIELRRFIDRNRDTILAVGAAASVVGGLATGLFAVAGVIRGVSAAISFLSPVINIARSGFFSLTIAAKTWGAVTTMATLVSKAAFAGFATAYAVGQGIITAATAAYNFVTALATGATTAYSGALGIAAIWETIVSGGAWALATALGAVAIAAGGFVLLTGGIIGLSFAVSALGIRFENFHSSLSFIDDALTAVREATVAVWNIIVSAVTTAYRVVNQFLDLFVPGMSYIRAFGSTVVNFLGSVVAAVGRMASALYDLFAPAFARIGDVVSGAAVNIGRNFAAAWAGIYTDASTAISGISSALRAGRWDLVWEILKTAGSLAWLYLKDLGATTWVEVKFAAFESLIAIGISLRETFYSAWDSIKSGFIGLIAEFKALWAEGIAWVEATFYRAMARRLPQGSLARNLLEGRALDALRIGGNQAREIRNTEERDLNTRNARFQRDADQRGEDDATARTIRESQLELDRASARGDQNEVTRLRARLADLQQQARDAEPRPPGERKNGGGEEDEPEKWSSMGGTFSAAAAAGMFGGGDLQTQIRDLNRDQLDVQRQQLAALQGEGVMAIDVGPNADALVNREQRDLAQNGNDIIVDAIRNIGETQIDRLEEIARILDDIRNREGLVMG